MTKQEEKQILKKFSWATSRIATKMIPAIRDTYEGIDLIDLLLALPIVFKLDEIDYKELPPTVDPKNTIFGGYITRDTERGNPDRMVVHITLTKDVNITWDAFFDKLVNQNNSWFQEISAFVYLHEALHILMRHYDFYLNQTYYQIMDNIRSDLDKNQKAEILNHAFDYWINAYLIENAAPNSVMRSYRNNREKFPGLYDPNLAPGQLEQQEIVVKLTKEAKITKEEIRGADGNIWGHTTTIEINGERSTTVTIHGQHLQEVDANGRNQSQDQEQEISEVLDSTRRQLLERTKGEDSQKAFTKLGVDYTVPLDWFKYLKSSIFNVVQKYTSNYDQTWSRLKNKFRHIAPMPGRIYYEKELAAIISIDQSGSMSDLDLEKINYVVSELAKKTVFVEILLHDSAVAKRERFKGHKPNLIKEFITTRVACGGTSHAEVFQTIQEIKEENPKMKFIYLSFSDNWSDIDQVYDPSIFQKVIPYWIVVGGDRLVNVPGMQISLEDGLLQA